MAAFITGAAGAGLRDLAIGKDGRVPTSKAQHLMWTLGISVGVLALAVRLLLAGDASLVCATEGARSCVPTGT